MDQPITRAEHEEFKRRLEEENARQDRRIALLEESVSKMGALSTSVEKLALSMESMVREQEKQGKRLDYRCFSRLCVHPNRFLGGVQVEHHYVPARG